MRNFIQAGDVVTATAPAGGVTSGDPILAGGLFGVAATTQDAGASVEVAVAGVFDLAKAAEEITAGHLVHYDSAAGTVTTTGAGNPIVGFATADATAGAATVPVRLLGAAIPTA